MQFCQALPCLLYFIITAKLCLRFVSKMEISNTYMCAWVQMEDVLKLAFIILPAPGDPILVNFHPSCHMGYVKGTLLFCATIEKLANLSNQNAASTTLHPLDHIVDICLLPDHPSAAGILSSFATLIEP